MEGLIPYIYRAIKRRKERRYFRSMSTGASQWFGISNTHKFLQPQPIKLGSFHEDQNGHRRHRSLEDFSGERFSPEKVDKEHHLAKDKRFGSFHEDQNRHRRPRSLEDFSGERFSPEKVDKERHLAKDKRFGSSRMFACVTGAS